MRRDAIFLHAAGALEDDERSELTLHLATGCPRCADALAHARNALALLVQSLDPVAPPAGSKERLLARIAANVRPTEIRRGAPAAGERNARFGMRRRVASAAALAFVLGAGLAAGLGWRLAAPLSARNATLERSLGAARAELAQRGEELAEQDAELSALEAQAGLAAEQVRLLRAPGLEVMTLSASLPGDGASARIFWEPNDYACYFHAERMAAPPPERTYALWLVSTRGEVFAAASFAPDRDGEVALLTKLPKDFPPVARTFVTDEPSERMERPTGTIYLLGEEAKARAPAVDGEKLERRRASVPRS